LRRCPRPGIGDRLYTDRLTLVNFDEDRVEFNNGKTVTDLMGNMIKRGSAQHDIPVQYIPAEFQVGKRWTAAFSESVSSRGQREVKLWLVPGMNFEIRSEYITRNRKGRFRKTDRYGLVSMRQQASGMTCAAAAGGAQRNLVIKSNCPA